MPDKKAQTTGYGFGTFKGVLMPSLLTILGVVMYMRFGFVVGQVGLRETWAIVIFATSITFLTGLSLSALATNMKVGGGGAYYIISRSLGIETGAAVGIPLYFAQATGVSFYIAGFSESLLPMVMNNQYMIDLVTKLGYTAPEQQAHAVMIVTGVITLVVLTVVTLISANLALRSQFLIFAMIILSLAMLFTGANPVVPETVTESAIINSKFQPLGFWAVFAIFFPAVTGIEAGISMSGDLKDPAKSLPKGTLAAIGISLLIYLAIPTFLYVTVKEKYPENWQYILSNDSLIMTRYTAMVALPGWVNIILWAIWGASISSAMGAVLGAPRTLQALSKDRIIPSFLGRGFGKNNDPHIATGITFIVAFIGIVAGNLDVIAPVLSMFFLTSYCLLNLSAAAEGMLQNPSWRPTFKIHWLVSLFGAIGCLFVMIQINFIATIIAAAVSAAVFLITQKRSLQVNWSDVRSGLMMKLSKIAIYNLVRNPVDEKNWQPNLMVLSGAPTSRWYLIRLANAIAQQKGFLTVAAIIGNGGKEKAERIAEMQTTVKEYLEKQEVNALVKVHPCDGSILSGAQDLIRTYGFGPLVPNTIMLGKTDKEENLIEYARLIRFISRTKRNLVLVREGKAQMAFNQTPQIDIWWRGWTNFAAFKLAIAFYLSNSPEWAGARIVLKNIVKSEDQDEELRRMEAFIKNTRLEATAEVIVHKGGNVFDTIRKSSSEANLVFIGLRPFGESETEEEYAEYYRGMINNTKDMPPLIQTLNSEDVEFQRIFQ